MTEAKILPQKTALPPPAGKRRTPAKRIAARVIIYVLLALFVLWILVPFYTIVISSFKTDAEALDPKFTWWPKEGFHFEPYLHVFETNSYTPSVLRGFLNTLWVVIPPTVLGLLFSAMSAYSFAKLRFPAKSLLFSVLILTMMIPGIIMLTPSYFIYDNIGWVDTPLPLMIPGMFGAAACVFFMRQFYFGIPTDLVEAAKLDGLGYVAIFFRIMVPLSVPALLAQGVLGFIGGYNDYFGPLLYLRSPEIQTLQIALANFADEWVRSRPTVLAGAVMALLPTLLIYIFAQKYFIQGIATSGMKL